MSSSQIKLLWTQGRIMARLGRLGEAREALEMVRRRLLEIGGTLDYVLASVELAEIFFLEGKMGRARELAGEMFPLLKALQVDRDAFDAMKLFYQAALSEALTTEVFRVVKKTLGERAKSSIGE